MELDASNAAEATLHRADVCIVGAGPAGLALARALMATGVQVVLLESGGDPSPKIRDLNAASTVGNTLADFRDSRARGVGGTSALWNTVRSGSAGAKFVALDAIDFMARPELPSSGWPLTKAALDPWYAEARVLLRLPAVDALDRDVRRLPFGDEGLTTSVYQWAPAEIFRQRIPDQLRASNNVLLITSATVTELVSEAGVVSAVHWRALSGATGTVRAGRVVLACGAIENARLLLASAVTPFDPESWLGRGLMEHPIDRSLRLHSSHPAISPDAGCYAPFGVGSRVSMIGRIGCADEWLRRRRFWNASLRLFMIREKRLTRMAKRIMRWLGRAPVTSYRVFLDLEQAPHRDNRVGLGVARDRFGTPQAEVHWQWRAEDEANRQRVLAAIIEEFRSTGAGTMELTPGVAVDPDVHHHAGTTRMHADPKEGVVDADLRVHGTENLYVVGASVFPTGGVANPTLTMVALALRLGDTLCCQPATAASE